MRTRNDYLQMRRRYEPGSIKLAIIAESPPVSGLYFYDPTGKTSEPLFSALMQQLSCSPTTKDEGLREFQRRGWILVDATYEPVNEISNAARDKAINEAYPLLLEDLEALISDRSTPLILIKANVCRMLTPKLKADQFNVLNNDEDPVVVFPSTGGQKRFREKFGDILSQE